VIAIQIVLVAPLIGEALARVDLQKQLTWLLIAVTGTMVLLGQLNGPIVHALPWTGVLFGGIADRIVVFWTAYVVLGAVMGLNWESTIALIRRYRLVLLAVYALVAVALVALIARQSSVVAGDYQAVADMSRVLQPWIVPFEILSILAWLYLSGLVARTRVGKPIAALSSASFGGYLIHPFWLLLATQWVYANNPMPNAAATVLLVTAFALAASYLSVVAISRVTTPLGTALIGASPAVAIEAKVDPLESKAG
jgi:membrane-bound acyltransferase YfiQ involved in biofilm formation